MFNINVLAPTVFKSRLLSSSIQHSATNDFLPLPCNALSELGAGCKLQGAVLVSCAESCQLLLHMVVGYTVCFQSWGALNLCELLPWSLRQSAKDCLITS
jgi:hypothetical protein